MFVHSYWKGIIFNNAKELNRKGISVANDLTPDQQNEKKELKQLMPDLQERNFNPKLRDEGILIDSVIYSRAEFLEFYLRHLKVQQGQTRETFFAEF